MDETLLESGREAAARGDWKEAYDRLAKADASRPFAGEELALLAAHRSGWDPRPGLAMVYLARGDVPLAAESIRDALDHPSRIPSKELPPNTALRRAPLLEAQVEIAIAAGDIGRARWAAEELGQVAADFESRPLAAGAALARGEVLLADGDPAGACRAFQTALELWNEVGAPYEAALAHMGLARAYRAGGNGERGFLEARSARAIFEQVGATLRAERAAQLCGADGANDAIEAVAPGEAAPAVGRPAGHDDVAPPLAMFSREGEYWSVTFEGRTIRLRDAKGLRYLVRLLADPGRELHVLDLVAAERGWSADERGAAVSGTGCSGTGDAGEMLDAHAKEAYRRRLADMDEDLADARSAGDEERQAQTELERDFLIRELSRAVGLGGRDRRAGSASERARASVTRAVRFALARIREHDPALGEHLDGSIRTGTCCAYRPDPRRPVAWRL